MTDWSPIRDADPTRLARAGAGWHLDRRRPLLTVAAALLAIALVVAMVWVASQGRWTAAVGLALMASAVAALAWPSRRPDPSNQPVPQHDAEAGAVLLPMRRASRRRLYVVSVIAILAAWTGAVALTEGEIFGGIFALLIAGGAASMLVEQVRGMSSPAPDGLLLTPTEVRAVMSDEVTPWAEADGVRAWWSRSGRGAFVDPREGVHNWLTVAHANPAVTAPANLDAGIHGATVSVELLEVDPMAAYEFVRFYAENPTLRSELGDGTALSRWPSQPEM